MVAAALHCALLLVMAAGARGADDLFDRGLHRAALAPALCARQLAGMRRADFYDASFRAPEGLLVGNLASLGNYHQCLAIDQDFPVANIQGKYCLIRAPLTPPIVRIPSLTGASGSGNVTWTEVTLPEGLMQQFAGKALSLAVCVPKSCAVEAVLAPYAEHPVVGFNYTEQYCRLPGDKPYATADYVAMVVFLVLGILTLVSTAYELRHIILLKRDPGQASALLSTCSLYSNTRRLLTFDKPRALDCLDGIRSLSILFIIIFHTFCQYFYFSSIAANTFDVHQWLKESQAVWMASGNIVVDSFFTLSGLLLVYTSVNKMKPKSLLRGLHWFYLNRFLRLFPLLACAVLLQASLVHHAADGPGWHTMADEVNICRRYWWTTLLHVQNIVNPDHMCVTHAWYLAVDMQLHLVSPLVLYWVLGGRRVAWAALAAALLASLAATLAYCYFVIYDLSFSAFAQWQETDDLNYYFNYFYLNTLVRSPPFLIGMLFGYILQVHKGQKVNLSQVYAGFLAMFFYTEKLMINYKCGGGELRDCPQWVTVTCHTLSVAMFVYVIYIVHPRLQEGWDNHFVDVLNNTFRRPGWSLALCWLIFACVHGYAGPVNWFLSLRLWKFVARISYAMYLFHYFFQNIHLFAAVTPIYFDMDTLFSAFASDLVYTVAFSMAICIIVEEPAFTLHRMLLRGVSKQHKTKKEENKSLPTVEGGQRRYNVTSKV